MVESVHPAEIEKRSFAIIEEELKQQGVTLPEESAFLIKRAIHTTADFSYAKSLYFSPDAIAIAEGLLKKGATIVTDTNMALSGINKHMLTKLGCSAHCYMADDEVAREAKERGCTRAVVSMERAAALEGPVIFAVGNAPTALIRLREMLDEGSYAPAFVIGVPVGFVNVVEAKELIRETAVPCILNLGRKGGSNVAAAICNALLYHVGGRP